MNKKYKILISLILIIPLFFTITRTVNGASEFTKEELAQHNTSNDCWMSFEENVYDFTTVLNWHRKYQDITPWCGKDMTIAFKTKDGMLEDHRPNSYMMLTDYFLGTFMLQGSLIETIGEESSTVDQSATTLETSNNTIKVASTINNKPVKSYNIPIPVGASIFLYMTFYFISKSKLGKKYKLLSVHSFNLFWNTVLLLSLIPAFGFGIFMVMQSQKPALNKISFDFLYWHVELSFIMGTVAIMHLIQRWKQYTMPYKMLTRKKK